jgi:predicted phage tail component-like protein
MSGSCPFSFTYRGLRSENFDVKVLNIARSILPPVDVKTLDIPGRAGSFFVRNEFGALQITVDLFLNKQDTLEEIQQVTRRLANFLDPSLGLGELVFDDEPNIKYQAIVFDTTELEQTVTFRTGSVVFLIPFPFGVSENMREFSVDGGDGTFTRTSTAYNLEGEEIATGNIRYEKAVFNEGMVIEEGTTNLVSADLSSFENNFGGAVAKGGESVGRTIKHPFHGNWALQVRTPGLIAGEGWESGLITGFSATTTYVASCYCIANVAEDLKIEIQEYTAGDVFIATQQSSAIAVNDELTGGLIRLEFIFTTSGTTAKVKIGVVTDSAVSSIFFTDGVQIEQKNYLTSWHIGGATRANELFNFPIQSRFNNGAEVKEGTVELFFSRINSSSGTFSSLFDWGQFSVGNTIDRISIFHGTSFAGGLQSIILQVVNGGSTTLDSVTASLPYITKMGDFYYVAARWFLTGNISTGLLKIDVYDIKNKIIYSNSKATSLSAPAMALGLHANAEIGTSDSSFWVNAIYDDFRATPRFKTDEEIEIAYQQLRPLEVDETGVIKFTFDEGVGIKGTDVSNIGTAEVCPIITAVVTSPAGFIQIEQTATGKFLRAEDTFLLGDIVEFDCKTSTVRKNGVIDMGILTLDSEFYKLPKNDNILAVSTNGGVNVVLKYNPNFL